MSKSRISYFFLSALIAIFSFSAHAEDNVFFKPAESYLKNVAVGGIVKNYTDWDTAELSGKLKMPGLPLSPSLKIFMVRDELLRISVRASFLGEVARLEIDRDSVLIVNKMKRNYCKESISDFLSSYPAGISDLQSVLLARIVFPGYGLLSNINASDVDFYPVDNGGWMVVPDEKMQFPGFKYGYLTFADGNISGWIVTPDNSDNETSAVYSYNNGTDIDITVNKGMKDINISLQLDKPVFGSAGFDPLTLNSRYQRLTIKDFIRQLT